LIKSISSSTTNSSSSISESLTWKGRSSTPCGSIRDSFNNCEACLIVHLRVVKWIIFSPNDLSEDGECCLNIILFLSSHTIQQTTLLINSTKKLSLRGILQSINHKSSKVYLWNKKRIMGCNPLPNTLSYTVNYKKIVNIFIIATKTQDISPCPFWTIDL
jgi:hypothetical protein